MSNIEVSKTASRDGKIPLHGPEAFAAMRKAGRLAAEALVLIGRRADLALLDTPLADAEADFPAIKTNTIFAVRRRTLN